MDCHYSCSSCSASVYLYYCLTCPSTRQLLGSTCVCSDGLLQVQASQCITSLAQSIIGNSQTALNNFLFGLYYLNVGLFWLYVIFAMCRVNLPKIRLIIMFGQLASLINYFPFYQYQSAKLALATFEAFNFDYLMQIYTCTKTGLPTVCTEYQNLIGPIILLPIFFAIFLSTYVILNLCYSSLLDYAISLMAFIKRSWFMLIFHYVDLTAVYWAVSIARVIQTSNWAYFVMGGYLLIILFCAIFFYRYLNNKAQITHLYRVKYSWLYLYDEHYHLAYIDYIYQFQRTMKQQKEEAELLRQSPNLVKAFVPSSNFIILQLFFKLLIGASSVVLFTYKPALFAIPVALLFIVGILYFRAFQYQNWDIVAYISAVILYQILLILFWTQIFWAAASVIAIIASTCIVINFGVLVAVKVKMNQIQINNVFKEEKQEQDRIHKKGDKFSEDDLIDKQSVQKQEGQVENQNTQVIFLDKTKKSSQKRLTFERDPNQSGLLSYQNSSNAAGKKDNSSEVNPSEVLPRPMRSTKMNLTKNYYNSKKNLQNVLEDDLEDILQPQN